MGFFGNGKQYYSVYWEVVFVACLLLFFSSSSIYSQSNSSQLQGKDTTINVFDFEPLGNLLGYDISYERRIVDWGNGFDLRMDVGGMYFPLIKGFNYYQSIGGSAGVKGVYSFGPNAFKLGIDYNYIYLFNNMESRSMGRSMDINLLLFNIGYRYNFNTSPLFLGLSLYAMLPLDANEWGEVYTPVLNFPIPGLSLGYQF